jgi:hypothetical protein
LDCWSDDETSPVVLERLGAAVGGGEGAAGAACGGGEIRSPAGQGRVFATGKEVGPCGVLDGSINSIF